MAQLHSLIRFKGHELDEKRQILSARNAELSLLEDQKKHMLHQLATEKNLASVDPDSARNFGFFMNRVLERIEALDKQIQAKMREVQAATQVVQEAFLEVKKIELTQEKRDAEETARLKRLENNTLDEMGLTQFRQQQDQ